MAPRSHRLRTAVALVAIAASACYAGLSDEFDDLDGDDDDDDDDLDLDGLGDRGDHGQVSRVSAEQAYVRHRPNGAAFDYFMGGDVLTVHGASPSGTYLCVSGTTRYGLDHTGWIGTPHVDEHGPRTGQTDRCTDYSAGGTEVSYPCWEVGTDAAFRYGPVSQAERIVDDETPTGWIVAGRRIGRATTSTGAQLRAPEGDYVWVARGCEDEPGAPDVSPGKVGWVRLDALLDPGTGGAQPEPPQPEPPQPEPPQPEPPQPEPPQPPAHACYARCCDQALIGPADVPDAGACHDASQLMCANDLNVLRSEFDGQLVWERPNQCWARCNIHVAWHDLEGVDADCHDEAVAWCSLEGRGGLYDAQWSHCEPHQPA